MLKRSQSFYWPFLYGWNSWICAVKLVGPERWSNIERILGRKGEKNKKKERRKLNKYKRDRQMWATKYLWMVYRFPWGPLAFALAHFTGKTDHRVSFGAASLKVVGFKPAAVFAEIEARHLNQSFLHGGHNNSVHQQFCTVIPYTKYHDTLILWETPAPENSMHYTFIAYFKLVFDVLNYSQWHGRPGTFFLSDSCTIDTNVSCEWCVCIKGGRKGGILFIWTKRLKKWDKIQFNSMLS